MVDILRSYKLTLQEAMKAKSFLQPTNSSQKGDLQEGFNLADHTHRGEMTLSGQEHFYLETQGCLVVPDKEDGQMLAFSSTQDVAECQVKDTSKGCLLACFRKKNLKQNYTDN